MQFIEMTVEPYNVGSSKMPNSREGVVQKATDPSHAKTSKKDKKINFKTTLNLCAFARDFRNIPCLDKKGFVLYQRKTIADQFVE